MKHIREALIVLMEEKLKEVELRVALIVDMVNINAPSITDRNLTEAEDQISKLNGIIDGLKGKPVDSMKGKTPPPSGEGYLPPPSGKKPPPTGDIREEIENEMCEQEGSE